MIRVPGGMERNGARFHHTAQNGMQFDTYELFISGIFHFIFSDHGLPWVTEFMKLKLQKRASTVYIGLNPLGCHWIVSVNIFPMTQHFHF